MYRGELNYTVIDTAGRLHHQGKGGLTIIDGDGKPILTVSEVSDDETTNVFLNCPGDSSGIVKADEGWEILRRRGR